MVGLAEMQTYKSIIAIKESRKKILMAVPLSPPPSSLMTVGIFQQIKMALPLRFFLRLPLQNIIDTK